MALVDADGEREDAAHRPTPKACPLCGTPASAEALFCSLDGAPLTTSPLQIASATVTDPYLGREILGHIEIHQLVGIGAMGRVYRAFQRGIDRDLAVKILHRELSTNDTLVSRFQREAQVASRLAHPNVVHVLLVGQLPDGALYIVMEYLDGLSLQSALAAAGGAMPLPRALHIALQLCEAAGEGHAQRIVHRDLKPENVMLVHRADDPDFVKVLDFGIARLNWSDPATVTAAGLIFGTARYISPEGAQGERVGPPGDVYSIATIVYQMLSGQTPFDAKQAVALLVQQIHDPPPPLTAIPRAAYVPDPIAAVVMQNLSKRPEERAGDARGLGRALLDAAIRSGLGAQDILARPSLLHASGGARGAHAGVVQMPSLQRTQQHLIDREGAAPVKASPSSFQPDPRQEARQGDAAPRTAHPTAYETPKMGQTQGGPTRAELRTEIPSLSDPPGSDTTKWSSLRDFEARLLPVPPSLGAHSGIDATMTDNVCGVVERMSREDPLSRAPSSVDITVNGDLVAGKPSGHEPSGAAVPSTRVITLFVACFFLGVVGMGAIAQRARQTSRAGTSPPPMVGAGVPEGASYSAPQSSEPGPLETNRTGGSAPFAVPPLSTLTPPAGIVGAGVSPSGGTRVSIDVASAHPGVGQPVDFTASVTGGAGASRMKIESASFRVAGPGLPGADLPALEDGPGVFRTTFTFLQSGRFDVTFVGRSGGSIVRAARLVVVSEARPSPTPPPDVPVAPGPESSPGNEPPRRPPVGGRSKWL